MANRIPVLWSKDSISVLMERQQAMGGDSFRYRIECTACTRACDFSFTSPSRLSFVAVGKLAAVFSLPCRRFMASAAQALDEDARSGRDLLTFSAEELNK